MNKEELYQYLKERNVAEIARTIINQCDLYIGASAHRVHGDYRQHFFLLQLPPEVGTDISLLNFTELRKQDQPGFNKTLAALEDLTSNCGFQI